MARGRRLAPAPTLRPLGEVLDYLEGLGFDHLYLRQPSSRAEPSGGPSAADSARGRGRKKASAPTPDPAGRRRDPGPGAAPRNTAIPENPAGPPQAAPERVVSFAEAAKASPQERFELLERLQQEASSCFACGLSQGRQNVVFSDGQPNADLMLVGEGPGVEEDRRGFPFVGPAGALLNRILQAIDLRREEVYIANTVKCRPPRNRDPDAGEVAACRPFLEQQIDLVRPKMIVVLGRVAAQTLLQSSDSLGRLRGRWHEVRGVPTRATYHPAALLRYEKYKRPTWEDMKVVRDRLGELRGAV